MERYYNIAGINICISGNADEMYIDERVLKNFKVDNVESDKAFNFEFADELPEPEGYCVYKDSSRMIFLNGDKEIRYIGAMEQGISGAYLHLEQIGKLAAVKVKRNDRQKRITTKTVLNAVDVVRLAVEKTGVVLHASYIMWNKKAILFTAPSGTGKSTQADLWKTLRGAKIINGDRVIIKHIDEGYEAWGLPYSGSSKYCDNIKAPLSAIVCLSQNKYTEIQKLVGSRAFRSVWEGCSVATWNEKDVIKASDVIYGAITRIPVYHLSCTPDESAVIALENELKKEY